MKHTKSVAVALAVAVMPAAPAASTAAAATSTTTAKAATRAACSTSWGSEAKTAQGMTRGAITNARAGINSCFDRFVVDVGRGDGSLGYTVHYVPEAIQAASGQRVPVRGGVIIEILANAPAYDDTGKATYRPANRNEAADVSGFPVFRQVVYSVSFEGQTQFFVGTRGRLPMRAFVMSDTDGSRRLVVDVAHTW